MFNWLGYQCRSSAEPPADHVAPVDSPLHDCPCAGDPHTKTNLLLHTHLGRVPLPISDYLSDTKGVLDNTLRVLQVRIAMGVCGRFQS